MSLLEEGISSSFDAVLWHYALTLISSASSAQHSPNVEATNSNPATQTQTVTLQHKTQTVTLQHRHKQ